MILTRDEFCSSRVAQRGCLQGLAKDIAGYPASAAISDQFIAGCCPPLNILANPGCGAPWSSHGSVPMDFPAAIEHLALFKFGNVSTISPNTRFGYTDGAQPLQGLSLLFDPYVDAALAAHAFVGGRLPPRPNVLVLTDFGNLSGIDLLGTTSSDWALDETLSFLSGSAGDPTSRRLYRCLTGTEKPAQPAFAQALLNRELLIWNLMPMIRVASTAVGTQGLPVGTVWLDRCWQWCRLFLDCVQARTVIIAANKGIIARSPSAKLPIGSRPVLPFDVGLGRHMETLDHPYSWIGERFARNCEALHRLAPEIDKANILDLEE